jgi:hypothetical protein
MLRGVNLEPFDFCTWGYVCKKHKIDVKEHQLGHLAFCMWRCACKKHNIDVKGYQLGTPCFFVCDVACVKSVR